ncbi:hypothetical protein ACFLYQ_03125 [Chloroflexota bacterium]
MALKEGIELRFMHQACPEHSRRNHLTGTALMTDTANLWGKLSTTRTETG